MGTPVGNGDADTAESRLRALNTYFREHPVTGPDGHSVVSNQPRPTASTPGLPYNARVVDHIDATVHELAAHARSVNPAADPLPPRVEAAYTWYMEQTRHADAAQRQRRDTIVYRQQLEHAIAMGDKSVIPPHRCPQCRTFGLQWRASMQRAVCTNRRCLTGDGLSSTWTLARLAYERIAEKTRLVNAT